MPTRTRSPTPRWNTVTVPAPLVDLQGDLVGNGSSDMMARQIVDSLRELLWRQSDAAPAPSQPHTVDQHDPTP